MEKFVNEPLNNTLQLFKLVIKRSPSQYTFLENIKKKKKKYTTTISQNLDILIPHL